MKVRVDSLRSGDVFGRLTVESLAYSSKRKDGTSGERVMNCICECGEKIQVRTSNLKSGNTKSCGCLHSDETARSNSERCDVCDISSHMGYVCHCGSVNFSLLKSGKIECNSCTNLTPFTYKLNS